MSQFIISRSGQLYYIYDVREYIVVSNTPMLCKGTSYEMRIESPGSRCASCIQNPFFSKKSLDGPQIVILYLLLVH